MFREGLKVDGVAAEDLEADCDEIRTTAPPPPAPPAGVVAFWAARFPQAGGPGPQLQRFPQALERALHQVQACRGRQTVGVTLAGDRTRIASTVC
jgi:hypothetical protein